MVALVVAIYRMRMTQSPQAGPLDCWGTAFFMTGEKMGIINIVKNTKELYPKYVTIVKVGSFYYCYGRDCYIMAYLLRYKINILKDNICTKFLVSRNGTNTEITGLTCNKHLFLI